MTISSIDDALAETITLMESMRDYVKQSKSSTPETADDPYQRLAAIRETSRMTGLLTAIMAWLLWQKASQAGEITPAELELNTAEVFTSIPARQEATEGHARIALPPDLAALVERSEQLIRQLGDLFQMPRI